MMFKWLVAQKLNLSSSLTLFKSEFKSKENESYIASAWDNRFIFSVSGTIVFPNNGVSE